MKYYIAYKFKDNDEKKLKNSLEIISTILEKAWNEVFIFNRDIQNWWKKDNLSSKEIILSAFHYIDKSDVLLVYLNTNDKSEWMLLEVGYAKAKNKKIIVIMSENNNMRFLIALADEIIIFNEDKESLLMLENKIGIL